MISDRSLVCFLHDLRGLLGYFKSQMPDYVSFINMESFNFYMQLGFPRKSSEMSVLMEIIEPYIPMIISPENLEVVIMAHENGKTAELDALEENLMSRSKFIFVNSVMEAEVADWENIVAICRKIRAMKAQQPTFV